MKTNDVRARGLAAILAAGACVAACFCSGCSPFEGDLLRSLDGGSACEMSHPELEPGAASCAPDAGCFQGGEIYLYSASTQCASHDCMVWQWDEQAHPEQRDQRTFCTCRCDGLPGDGPFCTCPSGYTCRLAFAGASPSIEGSYCVPSSL